MKKERTKTYFKITLFPFLLLLLVHLANALGLFNPLYKNRLEDLARRTAEKYGHFVRSRLDILKSVSKDGIVSTALVQAAYNNNLMDSLQHLNLYKNNFRDIRSITIFNPLYSIVLATELEDAVVNKNLNKDWFLQALNRDYFISDFSYHPRFHENLLTMIIPIQNAVLENTGFLMIDFSLEGLFRQLPAKETTLLMFEKEGRLSSLDPRVSGTAGKTGMNPSRLSARVRADDGTILILSARDSFFSLPLFLKILLPFFLILLLLFGFLLYAEKYIFTRTMRLKEVTDEIVNFSKKIAINELDSMEKSKGIRQEKPKQERPVEKKVQTPVKNEEKEKDFLFIE